MGLQVGPADIDNKLPELVVRSLREFDDHEPRVRDLDLAEWLGLERPRKIRETIAGNMADLQAFGVCPSEGQTSGPKGGRPSAEYWLNEAQALLICSLSTGVRASSVRVTLIKAFLAYRKGKMVPSDQAFMVTQVCTEMRQLSLAIDHLASGMTDRMDRHEEKIVGLERGQRFLTDAVMGIKGNLPETRRHPSQWTKDIHIRATYACRSGICPCCENPTKIVCTADKKIGTAEYDHWFHKRRNAAEETWLICNECNERLRDTAYKASRQSKFESYQQALQPFLAGPQTTLFQ